MAMAIAIALLVLGSVVFHLLSPWWLTPRASNWASIDDALIVTMWICAVAFVSLNLFVAWSIMRYRARPGHKAVYDPENTTLEKRLTFWTAIGIVGMLAPGLIAWHQFVTVPRNAAIVEATGQQWQWAFRFPGRDGILGTADVSHVTPENPFGINPRDPHGRDDILVESAALHLPMNRPIKMLLRSKDVLHDFFVPQFRARMDLVPGLVTYFWLTPTRAGTYEILCAELCGIGHHMMRGTVIVENGKAFDAWLAQQPTYTQLMAKAEGGPAQLALAGPIAKGAR